MYGMRYFTNEIIAFILQIAFLHYVAFEFTEEYKTVVFEALINHFTDDTTL